MSEKTTTPDFLLSLSDYTGLPVDKVQPPKEKPFVTQLEEYTGKKINLTQNPNFFSPGEIASRQIDLSAVYPEPIENYREYGVRLNPFSDWNEQRAQNQSTFEKWTNGLTKAGLTAFGAFTENTVGVLFGLGSLATGGSYYDNALGNALDDMNAWAQETMPNYYTQGEIQGSLLSNLGTANFWADKFANGLGYTIGSLATAWLTAGVGSASVASKVGTVGKLAATETALTTAAAVEKGSRAANLYKAIKVMQMGKNGKNVASVVDSGLDAAMWKGRVMTAGQNLMTGVQMSLAEASVEARETKRRFVEEKEAEWQANNPGQSIPTDVYEDIQKNAEAAGNAVFAINLPVLAATNMISFGGMLLKRAPIAEARINPIKKIGTTWQEALPNSGFGKAIVKSQRIFGKPAKNALSESFQEGTQFAASEGSIDYFSDYMDGHGDLIKSMGEGLSATFGSKEGLESMLIGALIGGGTGAVSRLAGAEKKLLAQKSANTAKTIEILNSGAFSNVLENLEKSERNLQLLSGMNKAIEAGDMLKAEQFRFRLIANEAERFRSAGALDYAMEALDDLQLMDETEFKKRWGYDMNKTLEEQTGKSQSALVQDVKDRLQKTVKRREQVEEILRNARPQGQSVLARAILKGSPETERMRQFEDMARRTYATILTEQMLDVDVIDEQLDAAITDVLKVAPELAKIPVEDLAVEIKLGNVALNEAGNITISPEVRGKWSDKAGQQMDEVIKAMYVLNPLDAIELSKKLKNISNLAMRRASTLEAFNSMMASPEKMDLFVEAELAAREALKNDATKKAAEAAIANAETADELNSAFPEGASEEDKLAASEKRDRLEKEERAAEEKFTALTDEEFDGLDPDTLTPTERAAYERLQIRKEEAKAEQSKFERTVEGSPTQEIDPATTKVVTADDLSWAELTVANGLTVSDSGTSFKWKDRWYTVDPESDPLDAILYEGVAVKGQVDVRVRTGLRLIDMQTGNVITWKLLDPRNSENHTKNPNPPTLEWEDARKLSRTVDTLEEDNAFIDLVTYILLLQANSTRTSAGVSVAEAKEEQAIKATALKEDFAAIEIAETSVVTEEDQRLEDMQMSKTAGLTSEQLRAQVEILKQDLIELEEIMASERQLAMEAGFSKAEFEKDPSIVELKELRKRIGQLLKKKIKELAARKRDATTDLSEPAKEEMSAEVQDTDVSLLHSSIDPEIEALQNELAETDELQKVYQDIINGKYPNQDIDAARAALKTLNRKRGALKAKITKRKNLLTRVENEYDESQRLLQEQTDPSGAPSQTEGEVTAGKDLDPGSQSAPEEVAATLTAEDVAAIEEQRRQTAQLAEQRQNAEPPILPSPIVPVIGPAPVIQTIPDGTAMDIRLTKGELLTNENFNVIVDPETQAPTANNLVLQTVNGTPIETHPEKLSDPEYAKPGTIVVFEVREDTDWWKENGVALPEVLHADSVPIFVINKETGERIGLLQSSGQTSGKDRKMIYDAHKRGEKVEAVIGMKKFQTSAGGNIANTRTADGQVFFYPASVMAPANGTPTIMYLGIENQLPTWKPAIIAPEQEQLAQDASKFPGNNTLGQIGILVQAPDGRGLILPASTRDVNTLAATAAFNHITKEEPDPLKYGEIVGCNVLLHESENMDTALQPEAVLEAEAALPGDLAKFIHMDVLPNGKVLFTFWSPSANSLVRINAEELKFGLLGGAPMFSFVEVALNEKGYKQIQIVKKEGEAAYTSIAKNLGNEFRAATMLKKMQVDAARLSNTEPYTSPVDGKVFNTYYDYLTAESTIGDLTEGAGSTAILRTDFAPNTAGSVFFDVGLEFKSPGTTSGNQKAADVYRPRNVQMEPAPEATPAPWESAPVERQKSNSSEFGRSAEDLPPDLRALLDAEEAAAREGRVPAPSSSTVIEAAPTIPVEEGTKLANDTGVPTDANAIFELLANTGNTEMPAPSKPASVSSDLGTGLPAFLAAKIITDPAEIARLDREAGLMLDEERGPDGQRPTTFADMMKKLGEQAEKNCNS